MSFVVATVSSVENVGEYRMELTFVADSGREVRRAGANVFWESVMEEAFESPRMRPRMKPASEGEGGSEVEE